MTNQSEQSGMSVSLFLPLTVGGRGEPQRAVVGMDLKRAVVVEVKEGKIRRRSKAGRDKEGKVGVDVHVSLPPLSMKLIALWGEPERRKMKSCLRQEIKNCPLVH